MNKDHIVPSDLYNREYYLSDNEGHREFSQGLDTAVHDKFKRVLSLVDLKAGSTVLDIGCGRGELVYYCAKKGAVAYGIDYSQDAVDIANEIRSRLPKDQQTKVFFQRTTAEEYTYDQKYDYVFMVETSEHMYDWQLEETFRKVRASLKPEGLFIATTPNYLYEKYFRPVKLFLDTPLRFLKMLGRVIRGKYKPKTAREFFGRLFRIDLNRGELNEKMHCNVMTPSRLRKLLQDFDANVFCEDPSLHPLSLLLRKWLGRQIIAVAKMK